jgi:hypothetical protein
VIARNSSFTYKGKAVDTKQVGRELGVRYVLEGSVRKAGARLRITGQLIDAMTGAHLWADRFDGSTEDVFELQDKVALSVAGVIEPALCPTPSFAAKPKHQSSLPQESAVRCCSDRIEVSKPWCRTSPSGHQRQRRFEHESTNSALPQFQTYCCIAANE